MSKLYPQGSSQEKPSGEKPSQKDDL